MITRSKVFKVDRGKVIYQSMSLTNQQAIDSLDLFQLDVRYTAYQITISSKYSDAASCAGVRRIQRPYCDRPAVCRGDCRRRVRRTGQAQHISGTFTSLQQHPRPATVKAHTGCVSASSLIFKLLSLSPTSCRSSLMSMTCGQAAVSMF